MKSILTVIGTRPEAIKLQPIINAIDANKGFKNKVCITQQHTDLLDPFLLNVDISCVYHFDKERKGKSLHQSAASILEQFVPVFRDSKPDLVLVQGDTTTAFVAALAAFYSCIPVGHIEAGLRTGHLYSPWPEEGHRCLISKLATYSFAPTKQARQTLLNEGIPSEKIWVVGNTSIDAVRLARKSSVSFSNSNRKVIVATVHRRENHGEPLKEICQALLAVAQEYSDVQIKFFVHPNPAVRKTVLEMLSGVTNIILMEPVDHISFVQCLEECAFIITDSGGIQEEAPFMGKPIIITRDTTERPEGILEGTARLVGTKKENIIDCCKELLENKETLKAMSKVHFPYGDGYAADYIIKILEDELL